jgi:hypothetical protein
MPKQPEIDTTQRSHLILKVMVVWIADVLHIQEILASNFVPESGYPD